MTLFSLLRPGERSLPEWHQLDQVVRVWYNPGGGSSHIDKLIPIYEEASAEMLCQLAVKEFNLSPKDLYRLCKVTVNTGRTLCVSVLRDDTTNLMNSIGLNERYYLKNMTSKGPSISDEVAAEMWRDSCVSIRKSDGCERIDPREMAIHLTLEDFNKFKKVPATEYVCRFFRKNSEHLFSHYTDFCDTQESQHKWVLSELISSDPSTRPEVAKFFIHVAKWCRKFRNYNSMFAILMAVNSSRLPCTKFMDKIPGKLKKSFDLLMDTINPDRNWKHYRELLSDDPPTIPIVSVLQKDLFSIYDSNKLFSEEQPTLVNFQFLRRYAELVLFYRRMCEVNYDVESMRRSSTDEPLGSLGANGDGGIKLSSGSGGSSGGSGVVGVGRSRSQAARQTSTRYQKWLIAKRIETYFARVKILTDEEINAARTSQRKSGTSGGSISNSSGIGDTSSINSNNSGGQMDLSMARKFGANTNDDAKKLIGLMSTTKASHHAFLPEQPEPTRGGVGLRRSNVHTRTPSLPATMEQVKAAEARRPVRREPPPYKEAIERQKEQNRSNQKVPVVGECFGASSLIDRMMAYNGY